jgi:hypothetical protein
VELKGFAASRFRTRPGFTYELSFLTLFKIGNSFTFKVKVVDAVALRESVTVIVNE